MNTKLIALLSLPALLLACGGADGGPDLTAAQNQSRAGTTNPANSSASPASSTSNDATTPAADPVDARQLLQAQVASAVLSLDEATDVALAANPGSQVLEADLDGDGAAQRFEIELRLADGSVVEVHVDATTGDIIGTFPEDDDLDDDDDNDQVLDCSNAISSDEAADIAAAAAGGTVLRVDADDDDCDFEVDVQTDAGVVEVDVAPDGTVLGTEVDDDDDDDDDDGDDD